MSQRSYNNFNKKNKKLSLNEKSKKIKKNSPSFIGRIIGKFIPNFKFLTKNKRKMIKDENNNSYRGNVKENFNIQNISPVNINSEKTNTIFSFYSHENKRNTNNAEFLDVLKTVENSINDNILLKKSETKAEKIKRNFLNLLYNNSFTLKSHNNQNSESFNQETSQSNHFYYTKKNVQQSEIINLETSINNNIENNNRSDKFELENEKEKLHSPSLNSLNRYHFWRSNLDIKGNKDGGNINIEINENNKKTENEVDSSTTSNSVLISPNRILLSESYIQSKQARKFNSLSNLYFKNSDKDYSKYFSDTSLKYSKKSSQEAYKTVVSKFFNHKTSTSKSSTDYNNYKDLLVNTKNAYTSSEFIIPKKSEEDNKKIKGKVKTPQINKLIEEINEKIDNALKLNDKVKLNESKRDYHKELVHFGKLIEEEIKNLLEKEKKNFPVLSDEALEEINYAKGQGPADEILIEGFNIPIKRCDIRTLINGKWLNDEVINFYGNLIMERSKNTTNQYPPVYFFNTFFFSNLSDMGYRAVRRWTKKFDLFLYKYIIIPIHLGNHWVCSAINFNKKRFEYYDSLHGGQGNALNLLRNYIQEESKDKKKCEMDLSDWEDYCPKDIPSQLNGFDCGVFTLSFAEVSYYS
ncbi:cysteine proteinase [Neocallimastix lanati (nom. inval.)]|nr:cysteine proteinase [Neocallimastix sp. JGI-2020a]